MPKIDVEITAAEYKALSASLGGDDKVTDWVNHQIKEKARKRMDAILWEITDRQPKKMSKEDRASAIMGADFSNFRKNTRVEGTIK